MVAYLIMLISPKLTGLLILALSFSGPSSAQGQSWAFKGKIGQGGQIDAALGPNNVIHMVSSRYYQVNASGKVIVDEAVGDGQQDPLFFPPAIAVGSDNTVHLITRHAGSLNAGFDIRYRRRAAGKWDRSYLVGGRVKRNYVVNVAWINAATIYIGTSQAGSSIWGDLHLWKAGVSSATKMGSISGIWRADGDARLRATGSRVFLTSGKPDPNGVGTYILHGAAGSQVISQLIKNKVVHTGSGRTAFPDLYVDAIGTVHLTYGAQQVVYYNKYSAAGKKLLAKDKLIFSGLGKYHIGTGLSAVAASDDGKTIVAVGLRSDGSEFASNSDILWTISTDGGLNFAAAKDLKKNTNSGDGRRRPRLVAIKNTFYLFYYDNAISGIGLAILKVITDNDGDKYTIDVDCDDQNKNVHPGATEICNGIDDNCDKVIDEGCPGDGGVLQDMTGAETAPVKDLGPTDSDMGQDVGGAETAPVKDLGPTDSDMGQDVGKKDEELNTILGGCGCQYGGPGTEGTALVMIGCLLLLLRIRRRSRFSRD